MVASTDLGDHERLDLAGMRNVRPNTQIDHWPATVYGGGGTIGNLGLDEVFLVHVVLFASGSISVHWRCWFDVRKTSLASFPWRRAAAQTFACP
jgi:hypothetical protein